MAQIRNRPRLLTLVALYLLAAPKFTVSADKLARNLLAFPVGNSVKLDCSADGYPRPTVRWYKDGALFQQRKGGSRLYLSPWTLLLTMKDLVPTDTGKYTCNVSNAYGWINHTYHVDVHGKLNRSKVRTVREREACLKQWPSPLRRCFFLVPTFVSIHLKTCSCNLNGESFSRKRKA